MIVKHWRSQSDRVWGTEPGPPSRVGSRPSQSPSWIPGTGAPPVSHTPRGTCHFTPKQGAFGSPAPMWATWEVTEHSLHRMPGGTGHRMALPRDWHCVIPSAGSSRCCAKLSSPGARGAPSLGGGGPAKACALGWKQRLKGGCGKASWEWLEPSRLLQQPSCRVSHFLSVPPWAAPPHSGLGVCPCTPVPPTDPGAL